MPFKMLSAVLLCLIGAAARADAGFYVGGSLGRAAQDVDGRNTTVFISFGGLVLTVPPESVTVDRPKLAWTPTLGYRVNDYFAAEVSYTDFGKADVTQVYAFTLPPPFPGTGRFTQRSTVEVTGPSLSALGTLPLGSRWDLFLRGGILFAEEKASIESQVHYKFADRVWLAGAGADFRFVSRWSARLEYQRTGALDSNLVIGQDHVEQIALGVFFRF